MITIINCNWTRYQIELDDLNQYPGWLVVKGQDSGLSDAEIKDLARRYDVYQYDLFLACRPQGDPHAWFLLAREIWPCHFHASIGVKYPRGDCTCAKPRVGKNLKFCFDCGGIP